MWLWDANYESPLTIETRAGAGITANGAARSGGSLSGSVVDKISISIASILEGVI